MSKKNNYEIQFDAKSKTNIHLLLYNSNSDYVRNTKSCFTSIEANKNQHQKQDI